MRLLRFLPFAAVVGLVFLLGVHTLTSVYQDIGRHLTLGRIIWESGSVPGTNLFSYTHPDFPFSNHHWLGEVLLYLGERAFGLHGLILAKALVLAAAFGLALAAAWRTRTAPWGMLAGVVAALVLMERTDVRPEIFSFLFLGWFLFVLYRRPHSRLLWTLPLVQTLWVNAHIYFFMGPFLVLAWWAGEVAQSGKSALLGRRHWLLVALVALATLVNPHGLSGALYPLTMWGNYGYSIVENKSPFFLRAFGYPWLTTWALFGAISLAVAGFIANRRHLRANVAGLLLMAGTAPLALVMIRNYPLLALCFLPVFLKNIDEAGWRIRSRAAAGWGVALTALLGAFVASGQLYAKTGFPSKQFGLIVPEGHRASVDFFRAAGIRGPLFNNFDIGSFLIWKLPEEPVFIDGRPEAYPAAFIEDVYKRMQDTPAVWAEQSAKYGINAIFWNAADITPWSRTFVARITADPAWVPVYRDNGIFILVRDAPQNAAIIASHRLR